MKDHLEYEVACKDDRMIFSDRLVENKCNDKTYYKRYQDPTKRDHDEFCIIVIGFEIDPSIKDICFKRAGQGIAMIRSITD